MSRETWNTIKQSKFFYVQIYRKALRLLIGSLAVNLLLFFAIYFVYLQEPENDYYATSGITAPVKLTLLLAPNYSDTALLPEETSEGESPKVIPQ